MQRGCLLGLIAVLAISLMSPAKVMSQPAPVVSTKTVDANFVESRLRWRGLPRPGFILRWQSVRLNGKIGICAAVAYPNLQARSSSQSVLRRAYVLYQDQRIMRNLTFAARVRREADLDGATANCAETPVDAPQNWRVRVGWGPGSARF